VVTGDTIMTTINITKHDAHAYAAKNLTIEELAIREDCRLETARKHINDLLKEGKPTRRKWSIGDKEKLRQELTEAAPLWGGASKVCIKWGLRNTSHALGILKIKSLDDLRFGMPNCRIGEKLRQFRLRLDGNTLKVLRTQKHILLTQEQVESLKLNPIVWLRSNIDLVKPLYPKTKKRRRVKR